MKLMMIIAGEEHSNKISTLLIENGFQATEIGRNGDFLQYGEMVLLVGGEINDTDKIIRLLRNHGYMGTSSDQAKQSDIAVYVINTNRFEKVKV